MKYMVLIAKHHVGFAQFDSKVSDHDIMASPYGKDIIRAYADACHKQGMKLGLYYSTHNWWHPDYLVGDNVKYDTFYRTQVRELLSNHGTRGLILSVSTDGQRWEESWQAKQWESSWVVPVTHFDAPTRHGLWGEMT